MMERNMLGSVWKKKKRACCVNNKERRGGGGVSYTITIVRK
jgi:hypothetical protein